MGIEKKLQVFALSLTAASLTAAPAAAIKKDDPVSFDFEHVSCSGAPNEIRVVVTDVKKSAGLLTVDLYPNREEGFLKKAGRIKQHKFAARAPQTSFCIKAPETGDFALAIYHDRNANGDFDKTGIGLPAEPWGLSQNPKVRFSAPKVENTVFAVAEDGAKVEIKLNN